MTRRRIFDNERHVHFVTFSCFRHRRLLDHNRSKSIVVAALASQLKRQAGRCVGFVVMPNHVHALVWFAEPARLAPFMEQWKRVTSLRIKSFFAEKLPAYAARINESDSVWQARYYDFNIYSETKLEEKLVYMHQNPVRAGLVPRAIDWPWSSARYYELNKSVGVPVAWID